ncbi:MAG: hypothetical protein RIS29_2156 [Bacteroidota bacterium]
MKKVIHIQLRAIVWLLLFFFAGHSFAQSVKLHWIDSRSATQAGVSFGVPFPKGKVTKSQAFSLVDAKNQSLALQTWPMAYWPDGSIKWLGCAAVANASDSFFLMPIKKAALPKPMAVTQSDASIEINTGAADFCIARNGNSILKFIRIDNKTVAENGRLVASLEKRTGEDEIQYRHFQSEITNAEVEQTGAVRTVVKITGVHKQLNAEKRLFPFTVRLYFYAGQKSMRMVHSFIYDGDQQSDFIKSLGVQFDVPMRESLHNRHIRFAGDKNGLWSESVKPLIGRYPFTFRNEKNLAEKQFAGERLPEITSEDERAFDFYNDFPAWNDYKLTQLSANGFSIYKRTNNKSSWLHADDGDRAKGLALVGDVSGGLAVSLKDFWQSYPATLEVNDARTPKAKLTVWLWAKEADAMDLRHYDTIPHGLEATYEDVQPGLSTPNGIARTSELTLIPFSTLPTKQETAELAQMGVTPPQLACMPEYLHQVRAFGTWSLPDVSTASKRWIESQLDSAFLYYKRSIDERHWYGFWNYGDVMHTYDPVRHVWKYDIGGFAWDNTELAPNNWLWYAFLRSGRADIYRMAEALTRHTGEVDCYHSGELKGLGSRHNVSHWGCGSKEARIGQAEWKRFYYYLTTDERCGDLMREALDAEKSIVKYDPLRVAQPKDKFPYGGPARLRWGPDWLALAGNWMTEWERTGNKAYRDKIITGLDCLSKLPDNLFTGPNGLSYDPATGRIWYDGKPEVTNKNHLATIMGGFELLTEMFDMIDCKPFRKAFTEYGKYYSMSGNDPDRKAGTERWGDINFLNPRLTAFAAHELKDDQLASRAWNEFLGGWSRKSREPKGERNIYGSRLFEGVNSLNPVHENPMIGTNGTAQWGLNAICMLELVGDKLPETLSAAQKAPATLEEREFLKADAANWETVFEDDFKTDWKKNWLADGEKADIKNIPTGLLYKAGEVPASDADHSVLWTRQSFEGDIRVEFDFQKKDDATKFVNILYLFAEGSGVGEYSTDISQWTNLRKIPAMKTYFEHMKAYHISFAAFENDNSNPAEDYIRARCYLPERGKGLAGTEIKPDYFRTGLFQKNTIYHLCIIRRGNNLLMQVKGDGKELYTRWNTADFPPLKSGRIGLRLMGSRVSEFRNFTVYKINEK